MNCLRPLRRLLAAIGSLRGAVALLALSIAAMAWGTWVERHRGADAAHAEVYGVWWFFTLWTLLGFNVLGALLARFPWSRRQAGFVVTHLGVLILLVGCFVTHRFGVEAQLPVFEGRAVHTAVRESDRSELDLGFQIRLKQFRRKLDPGGGTASHYSSLVDVLDRQKPPRVLLADATIALNAPLDVVDPRGGRTVRLFQSSFSGPWKPGDSGFDQLTRDDRSRSQIFLSRLSVNCDPGRWLKYIGSVMVCVGIAMIYYLRRWFAVKTIAALLLVFLGATGVGQAAEPSRDDGIAWQRLPSMGDGRIVPLDTFARRAVEAICGSSTPTLTLPDGSRRTFSASALLFDWLARPKSWENVAVLTAADPALRRDVLQLPLHDSAGRPLLYASANDVEQCGELSRLWRRMQDRAKSEGERFRPSPLEANIQRLVDAYDRFRLLTFAPNAADPPPERFGIRLHRSAEAWRRLAADVPTARRISRDPAVRQAMVQAGAALQKLLGHARADDFSRRQAKPAVEAFCKAATRLTSLLTNPSDQVASALAANLERETSEMRMALYDPGYALRLVPSLNAGALEANRSPDDDASPWLSFQAMIDGDATLMHDYPQPELKAVRAAWNNAIKQVGDLPRTEKALAQFADAVESLGRAVEPARQRLTIHDRDPQLLADTAYPKPGATGRELFYNRLDPFHWAWTVSLASLIVLLLAVGPWRRTLFWAGVGLTIIAQGFTALGLALRGLILGLVPLTGMFETVVFVALYAGLLGVWYALEPLWRKSPGGRGVAKMERVFERRVFAVAGAAVSFIALALACYAPATVMHRNLGAVTPILRDNFWLAVHVVTIMMSYASGAIAMILGNVALGYYLFGRYVQRRPPEPCRRLAEFIYAAIRITVLLLAAGTVLGAFWADKAWGRFWAWDPKEVWALISLLTYLLILHARHIGWSGDFGMALAAVLGAAAILCTWYGVNFLMGSGLHSYGAGAGGQWQVGSAMVLQAVFALAAACRYRIETRSP
ncbi:MAG: cytochrome c biogenesis protein CcsA [Thermoguttaceae bacterium]